MTRLISLWFITLVACGSKGAPLKTTPDPAPAESGSAVATPDPAKVKADLLAGESAAWDTAKPVMMKSCGGCHTKAGKKSAKKQLDHMNLDTYPIGGHHTGTIGFKVREVLGLGSEKATMPDDKPGSVTGDDLAKLKAWTDAWEAADKAGAHPPAAPDKDDD